MIKLPKGSVEFLVVDIEDKLENLTTLVGTGPAYDLKERNAEDDDWVSQNNAASEDVMLAKCLIDTTTLERVVHDIYIQFNNSPEIPRLGPFSFEVI